MSGSAVLHNLGVKAPARGHKVSLRGRPMINGVRKEEEEEKKKGKAPLHKFRLFFQTSR